MPAQRKYLTLKELSAITPLSDSTLRRLVRRGRIRFHQPSGKGGKLLFPPDALESIDETTLNDEDSGDSLPGRRPVSIL